MKLSAVQKLFSGLLSLKVAGLLSMMIHAPAIHQPCTVRNQSLVFVIRDSSQMTIRNVAEEVGIWLEVDSPSWKKED